MADNVTVDNGSLTDYDVATDDIGGRHYQYVKLVDSTADSTTAIGVAAAPLRVDPTGTTTQPVSVAATLTTKETRSTTATRTQVSDTSTDAQILASNANRLGATVYNDSSALLYLGLGTTAASSTNYTARVYPNGYYEVPANYTGEIRGIWATDPNDGAARVTELT